MSFLGKRNRSSEATPVLDASTRINNRTDVLETVETLRLPREHMVVVGSSALTLMGLARRANDLDVLLDPEVLDELRQSGTLPSGIAVTETSTSRPGRLHLQANTHPLPSELLSHNTSSDPGEFKHFAKHRTILSPDGLLLISPYELLKTKQMPVRIGDRSDQTRRTKLAQDAYDANLLGQYLYPTRR